MNQHNAQTAPPGGAPLPTPKSVEAEQAVIGAVIMRPDWYWQLADTVSVDLFHEALHARIWSAITTLVTSGRYPEPVVLASMLEGDAALTEMGGLAYLNRLGAAGLSVISPPDYAELMRSTGLRRGLLMVGHAIIESALKGHETGDEARLLEEAQSHLLRLESTSIVPTGFEDLGSVASRAVEAFHQAGLNPARANVKTGINALDRKIGGLYPADLYFLGGATSMGKTALAQAIAYNAAKAGRNVGAFSLEMRADEWTARYIAQIAGVSTDRMESGDGITDNEWRAIDRARGELQGLPQWIDGTPKLKVSQIRARAARMKRLRGLDLVIIDHLRFIKAEDPRATEIQQTQQITSDLKAMAKELNVPVLCLAHFNRDHHKRADHRPILSDLYGSSAIEQDADVVMFVHREHYYLDRAGRPEDPVEAANYDHRKELAAGKAEIIIGKRRRGPVGSVAVAFNEKLTLFGDLEEAPAANTAQASMEL